MCFTLYLVHDRQSPGASTDHEPLALPGYVFLDRERCVSKRVAELFRWLLIALANVPPVDHDIMLVGRTTDANRTKGKSFEVQGDPFTHKSYPG